MSPLPQSEVNLSEPAPIHARFLESGATTVQLVRAIVRNHTAWFTLETINTGGTITRENGVTVLASEEDIILAFPRMKKSEIDAMLDQIVAGCFDKKKWRVSCWSTLPTHPGDLGVRLAARGFEWGWKPHWMALNLQTMSADIPVPAGCEITLGETDEWDVADLPYYNRGYDAGFRRLFAQKPKRTWRFVARLNGAIVAQTVLFVTTGAYGVAGIYNVSVVPSARKQGIGRAISFAACRFAKALGCRYATLNAATHIYDRLGFVSLGEGQTWWMPVNTLKGSPPTSLQIQFAEAIGRGNPKALNALPSHAIPADLDLSLPNGMTPMSLSIRSGQPRSAFWLRDHGATLGIVDALDLGLREQIPQMLLQNPALVNRRFGPMQSTPVHEAVFRNDLELLNWLLDAHPDLTIHDTEFHSDALGWATHFGRTEMIPLFRARQGE